VKATGDCERDAREGEPGEGEPKAVAEPVIGSGLPSRATVPATATLGSVSTGASVSAEQPPIASPSA
jgi:hypothetical protein